MVTRGSGPLNDFLSTGTMLTVPGLRPILIWPLSRVPPYWFVPPRPGIARVGVRPTAPCNSTGPATTPQRFWYPASRVPPPSLVLPPPLIVPLKVPSTRYSRDDSAVVSGATASID